MKLSQLDKGISFAFNVIALVAMVKLVKGWFGKKKVKDDRANSK